MTDPLSEPLIGNFRTGTLAKCARRQLALYRRTCKRWVKEEKISPDEADAEIRMLQTIVEHFESYPNPQLF